MQWGWARAVRLWDAFVLAAVRGAVDAVRYQPQHTALVLACGASQPDAPEPLVRWWADLRVQPGFLAFGRVPHAVVRWAAGETARLFGPTGSVLVRWASGVGAAAADRATAQPIERALRGRAHPGLLVPHPHDLVVLAVDMRGFSHLTRQLHDTQYLSDLIGEYLTTLTHVVERRGGIVMQYTGDGLLAVFLPELLVQDVCPDLHRSFDELHARWRAEWRRGGRPTVAIGLGVGASFGRATIGFLGAAGKKQVGVIGEPVNVAAYLCSQARAGTTLVDCGSFARAGGALPAGRFVRLRSKKPHQRIGAVSLSREPPARATLPSPR
jgi:class 3 adenylate cyclase